MATTFGTYESEERKVTLTSSFLFYFYISLGMSSHGMILSYSSTVHVPSNY
jgi:hypothetical protein